MGKVKPKKASEAQLRKAGFYKGYDVNWLRKLPEHPEHKLVAEFDKKFGGKKGK